MKNMYYLNSGDRKFLFMESKENSLLEDLEDNNVRILYGSRYQEEDLEFVRTMMKVSVDQAINRWINDSYFILHLLLAAGIFLLSYYFFSYVIRDPLPLIDEIVLSALLGILGWYRLNNQKHQSDKSIRKKLEMEQFVQSLPCETSDFVAQVEVYLEELKSMEEKDIDTLDKSGAVPVFFTSEKNDLIRLAKLLSRRDIKKKNKSLPREFNILKKQIYAFLRYHSSTV